MKELIYLFAAMLVSGVMVAAGVTYGGDVINSGSDSANAIVITTEMSEIANGWNVYSSETGGKNITNTAFSPLVTDGYLDSIPNLSTIDGNNASAAYLPYDQSDISSGTGYDVIMAPLGTSAEAADICAQIRVNNDLAATIPVHDGANSIPGTVIDDKITCFQEDGTTAVVTNSVVDGYVVAVQP